MVWAVLLFFPYLCSVEETRKLEISKEILKHLRTFILYVYSDYESGAAG